MRWNVHGRTEVYRSDWVELWLDDVEVPGRERFDHHVVRYPHPASVVLGLREGESGTEVLLLWRHRFITDFWGYELPAGRVEQDEDPRTAAGRELVEETGWAATTITPMLTYHAMSGSNDMVFHSFVAEGLARVGEPSDPAESSRIEWRALADLPALIAAGEIMDGQTVTALAYYLGIWRHLPAR